ncbi:MAG TPA: polysaccharide biosynthesis/export family protein [Vicinamibacterales bacterium]|jgi:polysaccharide export outer membrane protein
MNVIWSLVLAVGLGLSVKAQQPPATAPPPRPSPEQAARPDPKLDVNAAYVIGSEDVLNIYVFDEPDLNQSTKYRVDADGMVTFALIGRVPAAGLTIRQFQDQLIAKLAEGYIRNPQVRVDVESYRSQNVYVSGEVRSPGKVPMSGPTMSLIEALALAGSPTAQASAELIVVHPKKAKQGETLPDDVDAMRTKVNIKDLQIGKAGLGIMLQAGDTVFVPKAQLIYISGMVRNAGSYVLDPGMTVQQALALAGGLNDRGSDRRITIARMVNNQRVVLKVKLTDIVQPNDTIEVGQRLF